MTSALSYKIEMFFLRHLFYAGLPERFHLKCCNEAVELFLIPKAIFPSSVLL